MEIEIIDDFNKDLITDTNTRSTAEKLLYGVSIQAAKLADKYGIGALKGGGSAKKKQLREEVDEIIFMVGHYPHATKGISNTGEELNIARIPEAWYKSWVINVISELAAHPGLSPTFRERAFTGGDCESLRRDLKFPEEDVIEEIMRITYDTGEDWRAEVQSILRDRHPEEFSSKMEEDEGNSLDRSEYHDVESETDEATLSALIEAEEGSEEMKRKKEKKMEGQTEKNSSMEQLKEALADGAMEGAVDDGSDVLVNLVRDLIDHPSVDAALESDNGRRLIKTGAAAVVHMLATTYPDAVPRAKEVGKVCKLIVKGSISRLVSNNLKVIRSHLSDLASVAMTAFSESEEVQSLEESMQMLSAEGDGDEDVFEDIGSEETEEKREEVAVAAGTSESN